jgi:hypothetical protein
MTRPTDVLDDQHRMMQHHQQSGWCRVSGPPFVVSGAAVDAAHRDLEAAVIAAWRSLADAIVERDVEHERRAWGELRRMAPEQVGWECEG